MSKDLKVKLGYEISLKTLFLEILGGHSVHSQMVLALDLLLASLLDLRHIPDKELDTLH
jgi:hypothetical protein